MWLVDAVDTRVSLSLSEVTEFKYIERDMPESVAAEAGLRVGDTIQLINSICCPKSHYDATAMILEAAARCGSVSVPSKIASWVALVNEPQ